MIKGYELQKLLSDLLKGYCTIRTIFSKDMICQRYDLLKRYGREKRQYQLQKIRSSQKILRTYDGQKMIQCGGPKDSFRSSQKILFDVKRYDRQ